MYLPARGDDEDARKLALAPKDGPHYLQHSDGSWSFVGPDGWPVDPEEFRARYADSAAPIPTLSFPPIDVAPVAVRDTEIP